MIDKVKIGVIGLGGRGLGMMKQMLSIPGVEVLAVCDLYEDRTKVGADTVVAKGGKAPFATQDYHQLVTMPELDAVMVMSAWRSHIDASIEALENGKYVAMEVGGAYSVEDCYRLVRASEQSGKPCMLLENCCYGETEQAVIKMIRKGVFGEIVHCSGGYMHDLRDEIAGGEKNRHYRLNEYLTRNCENYPTHELGPIAWALNINRGNRMISLASFASKACGMHEYVTKKPDKYPKLQDAVFAQGDIVTTVINCENGETIALTLDTTLPRPYSRGFTVKGTKGMYTEEGNFFYIEGKHELFHFAMRKLFNNGRRIIRRNRTRIWKETTLVQRAIGHGGMDHHVLAAFFDAVKAGGPTPIDVYDTASWMVISTLSEESIKQGGAVMQIPDFTNGAYKTIKPIELD